MSRSFDIVETERLVAKFNAARRAAEARAVAEQAGIQLCDSCHRSIHKQASAAPRMFSDPQGGSNQCQGAADSIEKPPATNAEPPAPPQARNESRHAVASTLACGDLGMMSRA